MEYFVFDTGWSLWTVNCNLFLTGCQKKLQSTVFNDHPVLAAIGSATILFLKFSMPVDIYFELCGAKLIGGGNLGIGEGQQSLPPNENLANESQPL